ncbi:hypothetical protein [Pseudomonas sp.]|uniref:hypothetical protein n=1 Tax=Pseudomonas sp. TaxID=306 RepID=UPI002FCAC4D5
MALDLSGFHSLVKRLEKLEQKELKVGVFNEHYDDGQSVAQVAMWQEKGTSNIPSRPFMQRTFDNDEVKKLIAASFKAVALRAIRGLSYESALQILGANLANHMKHILDTYPDRNTASTAARKGFNKVLYDSGTLYNSIKFRVHRV